MNATLVSVLQLTPTISTFYFQPEKPVRYTAGQFIELHLPHEPADERGIRRWFTLSSSSTQELLAITTKRAEKPSTYKQTLFDVKVGEAVMISQAMGDFVLPRDSSIPLLFVAIGMGITPAHSMLQWLADSEQTRNITTIYAAKKEDIIFESLLRKTSKKLQFITDRRIVTADITDAASKLDNPLIFISGPEEIVEVLVAELREQGTPNNRLVTDYFPGYGTN